jgi:hypothetical protein
MLRRRSRLVAKTGLARRTPLRTSREKKTGRRDTGPDRATRELVLERDEYRCVCCGKPVSDGPWSTQHRRARGNGGTSRPEINRPSNLIILCGSATSPGGCHLWCERRSTEAEDLGYVVSLNSKEDPADVPVHHWLYGLVYLRDDGGIRRVEPLGVASDES